MDNNYVTFSVDLFFKVVEISVASGLHVGQIRRIELYPSDSYSD